MLQELLPEMTDSIRKLHNQGRISAIIRVATRVTVCNCPITVYNCVTTLLNCQWPCDLHKIHRDCMTVLCGRPHTHAGPISTVYRIVTPVTFISTVVIGEISPWLCLRPVDNRGTICHTLASLTGPGQLFTACSTEKQVEPGNFSHVSMTWLTNGKKNQNEKAKFHILFNQLHLQCLVCMTVTLRLCSLT